MHARYAAAVCLARSRFLAALRAASSLASLPLEFQAKTGSCRGPSRVVKPPILPRRARAISRRGGVAERCSTTTEADRRFRCIWCLPCRPRRQAGGMGTWNLFEASRRPAVGATCAASSQAPGPERLRLFRRVRRGLLFLLLTLQLLLDALFTCLGHQLLLDGRAHRLADFKISLELQLREGHVGGERVHKSNPGWCV